MLATVLAAANYPLWRARQAVARRHDEVRHQGEILLRTLANRPRIEGDLAALRAANGQIEASLLDEQSMEVNLGYFYRLEKTTRVRLVRLNQLAASPPAAGSPLKAVPFSLQLTGSYRSTMSFLRALETGPRIVRIRTSSFERVPGENGDVMLDLIVEILAKT